MYLRHSARPPMFRRTMALVGGTALVLSACGGDDDDVADLTTPETVLDESTTPETTSAATTQPEPTEPGTTEPNTTEPDMTEPDMTEPSQPDSTMGTTPSTDDVIGEGVVCAASEEGGPLDLDALAEMDAASVLGQIDGASTFLFAAERADIIDRFVTGEDLTLFVPTDDAFEMIPEDELEQLLTDRLELNSLVLDHVVIGRYPSDQLEDGMTLPTATEGEQWLVNVNDEGEIMVAGSAATVVCPDIEASNAVIHLIDQVIITRAGVG